MNHDFLWALHPDYIENFFAVLRSEMRKDFPIQAVHSQNSSSSKPKYYEMCGNVAIIPVCNVIDRRTRYFWFSNNPYTTGQDFIHKALMEAVQDSSVSAILFDVESPGGVVAGTKELADAIADAKKSKPLGAYVNGLCASAAYWLAAATGKIFAPQTSSVGSIGIIAVLSDWSKYNEKLGLNRNVITSGKWKAAGHPDKPLTDEEREHFQHQVAELHQIFLKDVKQHMHLKADSALWGEGQTLLAAEAKELGLVTAIVRDRDAAIKAISPKKTALFSYATKENTMDKNTLRAEHPSVYAEIVAEAKAEAEQDSAAKVEGIKKNTQQEVVAVVKAVAGEEMSTKIEQVLDSGVSAEGLAKLAELGMTVAATPKDTKNDDEVKARTQALEAITNATGEPIVGANIQTGQKSALVADAERRAVMQ